ncbi:MAG: serine hydrolase [Actinomycetia bacterium]|nr:serine hydrolase [Actinomycetes bacterium]
MAAGLTKSGIEALHAALASHVERGDMPGIVALVARGDDVHIEAIGHKDFGDTEPIGPDAIFRIASITKPIVGVAAMSLVDDGLMALDDPVSRWLPELANPRVLRTLESELDDTVAPVRPITVEDVLSFRLGWGSVMAPPDTYPIQKAERELDLHTFGPPWPPSDLTPDQWIAALGSLPLLDQPGRGWRYAGGAQVAGVLVERVAGAPIGDVLRERIFEPLGMVDTGFYVPAEKLDRFTTQYEPDEATDGLRVLDRPDGWWSVPPKMPDGNGWLVSTVGDLWAFASMLAADGDGLLSPESVHLMRIDRMTAADRAANAVFVGDHSGWGLMMAVPAADGSTGIPGGYGWEGGTGTSWRTDPAVGLTGIVLTQRAMSSPEPPPVVTDFWTTAYAAIDQ